MGEFFPIQDVIFSSPLSPIWTQVASTPPFVDAPAPVGIDSDYSAKPGVISGKTKSSSPTYLLTYLPLLIRCNSRTVWPAVLYLLFRYSGSQTQFFQSINLPLYIYTQHQTN